MAQATRWGLWTRPWGLVWFSIRLHWEALVKLVRTDGLFAAVRLQQIRNAASAKLLNVTSGNFIAYEDTTVVPSLVKAASGVVLDLGPGPGNQIHRFDSSRVDFVYGIEPNGNFKGNLDAKLEQHGLGDKYKLLVCGIEDSHVLRAEGITEESIDAVLCIQVLCAVDNPTVVMKEIYKLLKPGGKFIFWEHGWSRDGLTNVAQALWNPAWSTFVGCNLNRNVLSDILSSGEWENPDEVEEPEDRLSLLPRVQGVLIKKA